MTYEITEITDLGMFRGQRTWKVVAYDDEGVRCATEVRGPTSKPTVRARAAKIFAERVRPTEEQREAMRANTRAIDRGLFGRDE